jgi:hypothetical protein
MDDFDYDLLDEDLDAGTSNLVDDVLLEEVDLDEGYQKKCEEKIEYPCLRIDGITSEDELVFFHNRDFGREGQSIPLYCFVEGVMTRIGDFELSVDSLLAVRAIADYRLVILTGTGEKEIDLNDPETIIKFINFRR